MSQLGFIAELLSDHPNAVLMGDFNCLAERPEMQVLYQKTRLQPPGCIVPTFPSWRPDRAIDHILVSSGLLTRTVKPYRPRSPITSPWRCRSTSRPTPCAEPPP